MEDLFLPYNLAISTYDFFFYSKHIQNSHFLTNGKDITASLRLRRSINITTLTLWGHYYGKQGLSEHKHCYNAATNSNSKNARSRMVASLRGSVGMGTMEDESSIGCIWAAGFHHVMAHSCLKLMNHLFLQFSKFFPGHSKSWITETMDNESTDTGVHLYCYNRIPLNKALGDDFPVHAE